MVRLFDWGESPPPEAYSRVTSPERFGVLVDSAAALVAQLVNRFDVRRELPDGGEVDVVRLDRLVPSDPTAAPLTVEVTRFPGVRLRAGHWWRSAYPSCGCDACDDDPDELIDDMRDDVAAVVGGFTEELELAPISGMLGRLRLSARGARAVLRHRFGARTQVSGVIPTGQLDELLMRAPARRVSWAPWPRR